MASPDGPIRPKQWKVLFDAFKAAEQAGTAYQFVSQGIETCIENANSLLEDFRVLAANNRNAAAQFSYATALEEMGKALILFDFVRIDWRKEECLKNLCKAVYHHLKKGGYARTVAYPGSGYLIDALCLFKLQLIEYSPVGDPESGEPDHYAASLIEREWAIYVDLLDYGLYWFYPPASSLAHYYAQEKGPDNISAGEEKVLALLNPLTRARDERLFQPSSLRLVHAEMARHYVTGPRAKAKSRRC